MGRVLGFRFEENFDDPHPSLDRTDFNTNPYTNKQTHIHTLNRTAFSVKRFSDAADGFPRTRTCRSRRRGACTLIHWITGGRDFRRSVTKKKKKDSKGKLLVEKRKKI